MLYFQEVSSFSVFYSKIEITTLILHVYCICIWFYAVFPLLFLGLHSSVQKPLMLCLESAEATLPSLGWQLLMLLLPLRPLWTLPS